MRKWVFFLVVSEPFFSALGLWAAPPIFVDRSFVQGESQSFVFLETYLTKPRTSLIARKKRRFVVHGKNARVPGTSGETSVGLIEEFTKLASYFSRDRGFSKINDFRVTFERLISRKFPNIYVVGEGSQTVADNGELQVRSRTAGVGGRLVFESPHDDRVSVSFYPLMLEEFDFEVRPIDQHIREYIFRGGAEMKYEKNIIHGVKLGTSIFIQPNWSNPRMYRVFADVYARLRISLHSNVGQKYFLESITFVPKVLFWQREAEYSLGFDPKHPDDFLFNVAQSENKTEVYSFLNLEFQFRM